MVSARASPDPVAHWIALFDTAEHLLASAPARANALLPVGAALDALVAHEHSLTSSQRLQARETLWRRDHAADLLPADRSWWADCTCRACRLVRRMAPSVTVFQAQLHALHQQRLRTQRKETTHA